MMRARHLEKRTGSTTKDGKTNVTRPKTMCGARKKVLVLFGVACVTVSSCSNDIVTDGEQPPKPSEPDTLDYSFVWHESPAVDLDSPTGTFIRAATESFFRSIDFGSISNSFLGFNTAVEDSSPSVSEQVHDIGNLPTEVPDAAGALDARVLSIETDGADTHAIVCTYEDRYLTSRKSEETYRVGADDGLDTRATEIVVRPIGTPPPAAVSGPRSRPASGSVFGEWKISHIDLSMGDSVEEGERMEQD